MPSVYVVIIFAIICSFITISPSKDGVAFGSHPTIEIYGTITRESCERIGGVVLTEIIDFEHTQSIEVCKYADRYFRLVEIYELTFFGEVGGNWIDPETGDSFGFGYLIDFPTPCRAESSWDASTALTNTQRAKLHVNIEGKSFDITTKAKGGICDFTFSQDEKSVNVQLRGVNGREGFVLITVPNELLSGELTMQMNGTRTNATTWIDTYNQTMSLSQEFTYPRISQPSSVHETTSQDVILMGTNVIPEFGILLLPLSTILFLTVMLSLLHNRSLFRPSQEV